MKGKCQGCTYNCCETEVIPLTLEEYEVFKTQTDKIFYRDGMAWFDSPCPFFNNGCMIYPIRPANCRQYPYQILEEGYVVCNINRCLIAQHDMKEEITNTEARKIHKELGFLHPLKVPTWWLRKIQRKYEKKYGTRKTDKMVYTWGRFFKRR